jgi:hypothetical protein
VPSEAARPTIAEVPVPEAPPRQAPEPESPPATEPLQPLASTEAAVPGPRPERPPDPAPAPAEKAEPAPEPAEAPDPEVAEAAEPEAPMSAAPQEARLPVARPAELAAAAPASRETRRPDPEPSAVPEPEPDGTETARAQPEETAPGARASASAFASRITRGEKDALRLGIKRYFVYNGNRADRSLAVRIGIGLDPSGSIVEGPELLDAQGGDDATRRALFQAGVRALRRAAYQGEFSRLPIEKYDAWKRIHVTFTPEDIGFPS